MSPSILGSASDTCSMTKPVPWTYHASDMMPSWEWRTDHFFAQIIKSENAFTVTVNDLTSGHPRHLLHDITFSHAEAVKMVLSVVGKSYPLRLRYREYAGHLATTFTIHDGTEMDFGPMEGAPVSAVIKDQGSTRMVTGSLQIDRHKIRLLLDSGQMLVVPPALIVSVQHRNQLASETEAATQRAGSRTIQAQMKPGCTGRPAFRPGYVEHPPASGWCPVHRV